MAVRCAGLLMWLRNSACFDINANVTDLRGDATVITQIVAVRVAVLLSVAEAIAVFII